MKTLGVEGNLRKTIQKSLKPRKEESEMTNISDQKIIDKNFNG
jgi:hypothetical protein